MVTTKKLFGRLLTTAVQIEAGDTDSHGYAEISSTPTSFVGATASGLLAATYKVNVKVDAGVAADISIVVSGPSMTWAAIVAALSSGLTGATASIVAGNIRITSDTHGSPSTILIAEGTTEGLLAAITAIGTYVTSLETPVDGVDATSGYATVSNTGTLGAFTGATVPALANATYDLDITVDGVLQQTATALLSTDDWDGIAAKIQIALRALTSSTETVTITDGKIKVASVTTGVTSTIVIAAGTAGSGGGDLLTAIDALGTDYVTFLDTPVDGEDATSGYAEVSSLPTTFVGATTAGLAADTYNLGVDIDGAGAADIPIIVTGITMTWAEIVAALSSGLTGATASIVSGNIRITSDTTGVTSTIVISDGTVDGILASIDALIGEYNTSIETPVDGAEGSAVEITIDPNATSTYPSKEFMYLFQVHDSTVLRKSGFNKSYDKDTGIVTITEASGASPVFAVGDQVIVQGTFYNT
jgi:hypothetical protein